MLGVWEVGVGKLGRRGELPLSRLLGEELTSCIFILETENILLAINL